MKRRHFLATVSAASTLLAGCTGTDRQKDAIITAVQKSPSEVEWVLPYDVLSQAEQQIARTAIEENVYHACPDLSNAIHSFADRFEQPDSAYLTYQGAKYALWIRIEDTVLARTASPPEREPSCGFF